MKRNDSSLLDFYKELQGVSDAQHLMMDMLSSDIAKLSEELQQIREPVIKAAEEAEAKGDRRLNLEELREQRTSVRSNGSTLQFNQVDHWTGRTSMERFLLKATAEMKALVALSDNVTEKYQNLLDFFQEDADMPSNEFFGTMNKFIKEFRIAEEQVEREEKAKEKERRRNEAKAKKSSTAAKAKRSTTHNGDAEETIAELSGSLRQPEKESDAVPISGTSATHPLAAILEAHQRKTAKAAEQQSSPFSAEASAGIDHSNRPAAEESASDHAESNGSFSGAVHPLAAMLLARQQSPIRPQKSPLESSASAHPLAIMLESRLNASGSTQEPQAEGPSTVDKLKETQSAVTQQGTLGEVSFTSLFSGAVPSENDEAKVGESGRSKDTKGVPIGGASASLLSGLVPSENDDAIGPSATVPPPSESVDIQSQVEPQLIQPALVKVVGSGNFTAPFEDDSMASEPSDEGMNVLLSRENAESSSVVQRDRVPEEKQDVTDIAGSLPPTSQQSLRPMDEFMLGNSDPIVTLRSEPDTKSTAWLTAVLEATGRQKQPSKSETNIGSGDEERGSWVSSRESMATKTSHSVDSAEPGPL